jgi:GxxExxY protein
MKYEEITRKIIGSAMDVHSTLGNGFQEVIYQRALAIEMEKKGLAPDLSFLVRQNVYANHL